MTRLSTNKMTSRAGGPGGTKFVPFTIYAKVIPVGSEKRFEVFRDLEEMANQIEETFDDIDEGTNVGSESIDLAKPVLFTPQFGDRPARVTIHGNITDSAGFTKIPFDEVLVINAGEYKTGPGARRASNLEPSVELDTAVTELKSIIDTAVSSLNFSVEIFKIDMAGFIYGVGGRHFPI